MRGHWVGLVSSILSLATAGVAGKVLKQPELRKRICGFLKPRISPASVAMAVKRRPENTTTAPSPAPVSAPAPALASAVTPPNPIQDAVREFIQSADLDVLRIRDLLTHISGMFGELSEDQNAEICVVAHSCIVARLPPEVQPNERSLESVADIKSWIVEQVSESFDDGLCLDGAVDALEEEVAEYAGAQDDATQSRWRQWIIEEAIRQDCGLVV